MTTKQRSKPLEPPVHIIKNKNRQKLSPIEKKLLECYKSHQPVLLYNDTLDKRNDLIMTTYIDNGGNLNDVHNIPVKSFEEVLRDYYYDEKRKISGGTLKGFDESLISFIEDIRSQKRKDSMRNKSREIFKSTEKSYRYHDCKGKYGEKVHHLLVADEIWIKESGIGNVLEMHRRTPELIFGEQGNPFIDYIGSYLLHFEGMLFVDNLECNKGIKDNVSYRRLADVIKGNKVSVNWLVVYVHNIGNFQNDFLKLFDEQICIEEEKAKQQKVEAVQSNAKENLSKGLEYIRWDDNEEKFYAKAKGKDREEQNPLKLTGQPYGILQCLFNEYDPKTKKASVPIDTVLYETRIKDHKKGDNISKDKRDHLSSKITPIKEELDDAGLDKDRIKIDNDYCELSIECRYDI